MSPQQLRPRGFVENSYAPYERLAWKPGFEPKLEPRSQFFIPAARQSAARGQETKPLHRIKGKHRPVLHRLREDVKESGASGAGSGHPCSPEEPKNVSKLTRERQAHPTQL